MSDNSLNVLCSDEVFVARLNEGDAKAFDFIFKKYYPNLCRFAFTILGDTDLSQGLVQNVFIKLWERRFVCGSIQNLPAYLTTMVKNQISDHIQEEKKHRQRLPNVKRSLIDESTEQEILKRNFEECLIVALSRLPDRTRQAFELSRFENLTNKEIAETMGISVKGVEALIGRSLKVLRKELLEFLPSFRLKEGEFILLVLEIGIGRSRPSGT
jgi:RNA polymerase sigma-70 factor (ECF subfamily)